MIFDEVRNNAYQRAIVDLVDSESVVLDLGSGLGIHGLMAAVAGARKVILLDPAPVVRLGLELAQQNGVADKVEVIRKRSEAVILPEPVDLIISVFTGNFLLSEDLLPSLFSARDRFLKPGGTLIPGRARMMASLVEAKDFYQDHVGRWSDPTLGIDFSPIRRFAGNGIYFKSAHEINAGLLSDAVTLKEFDFATAEKADCRSRVEVPVVKSGNCHGILGWFDLQLGDAWLSTGPDAEPMHWSLAFLPLDPPMELEAGENAIVELDRPEFGEWTWTVAFGDKRQRHSTFQYKMADLEFLRRQSSDYVPGLGFKGEEAMFVLEQMKAGKRIAQILGAYKQAFPERSPNDISAEVKIRNMANNWGKEEE